MSFRVVDTTVQQISSSGSLDGLGEQLQEAYWPEPGWWQAGDKQLQQQLGGSNSCLGEWQQTMLLDDSSYGETFEEVTVSSLVEEIELGADELEQRMSDNLWVMAAGSTTTAAQGGAPPQLCQQPMALMEEDSSSGLMSPAAYDLHEDVTDIPLQHVTDDSVEGCGGIETLDSLEPLSGSWIDTTSYVDQMATFEEFTESISHTSDDTSTHTCTSDNQFVSSLVAPSYDQLDSGSNDKVVGSFSFGSTDLMGSGSVLGDTKVLFDSSDVTGSSDTTLEDEEVAAEEITQQLFRAVKGESSGRSQLQLEQLLAQMFGGEITPQGSDLPWTNSTDVDTYNDKTFSGSSVDDDGSFSYLGSAVDAGFLDIGSTVDLKSLDVGSTVDLETLWAVDSGYQTATTSPTTSEVPTFSPTSNRLTSGATSASSSNRKRPASDTMSNESYTDDDEDDNDDNDDYVDDDDDDDDDFVPTGYLSKLSDSRHRGGKRSVTRTGRGKRKRREEYALLTADERRERKREQNKNAATKYRDKKRLEELEREEACDELERRNEELRREVMDKEREVKVLRRLVINIFRQPANETLAAVTAAATAGGAAKRGKRNMKRELLMRELLKTN